MAHADEKLRQLEKLGLVTHWRVDTMMRAAIDGQFA